MSLLLFLATLLVGPAPQSVTLTITTTGAQRGDLHLAVYANAADYAARKTIASGVKPYDADEVVFDVKLPASGDYVVSGYHDVNGNGKLDFNVFGIPKEPYGFVNPPASKWKAPEFSEISTRVDDGGLRATLSMRKWSEF